MASKSSDIQSFLECSICLEPYTNPKILPCFHTFCEHCLRNHLVVYEVQGIFPCPTCRYKVQIPATGVDGIDNSFFVKSLRDAFPADTKTTCDVCNLSNVTVDAVSMCINCADHLCQSCADHHHKSRYTVNHRIISMEDVRNGTYLQDIRAYQRIFCNNHRNKEIEIYCRKCEKPICILCKTLEHDDHKACSLEDAASKVNEQLADLVEPLVPVLNFLEQVLQKRKQIKNQIEPNKTERVKEIKKWAEMKHYEIDATKKKLLEDLEAATSTANKQADAYLDEVETQLATVKSTTEYVQKLVQHAKPTEKLQRYTELCDRLVQLQQQDLPVTSKQPEMVFKPAVLSQSLAEIKLHVEDVQVVAAIPKMIPVIGRILQKAELLRSIGIKLKDDTYWDPCCCDIAISGENMYVPDSENKEVKVFNKMGNFRCFLGDSSRGCPIEMPRGVAVDNDGNIVVFDVNIKGVHVYDKNRKYVASVRNLYSKRNLMARVGTNVNKQILLTDYKTGSIGMINYSGDNKRIIYGKQLGLNQFGPYYIATSDINDSIIVSCLKSKSVYILDSAASKVLHSYKPAGDITLKNPRGVCADQWGNIIVIDNGVEPDFRGSIHLVSSSGQHLALLVTGANGLRNPIGVAVSGLGEIAVIELNGFVKTYKYMDC